MWLSIDLQAEIRALAAQQRKVPSTEIAAVVLIGDISAEVVWSHLTVSGRRVDPAFAALLPLSER